MFLVKIMFSSPWHKIYNLLMKTFMKVRFFYQKSHANANFEKNSNLLSIQNSIKIFALNSRKFDRGQNSGTTEAINCRQPSPANNTPHCHNPPPPTTTATHHGGKWMCWMVVMGGCSGRVGSDWCWW